MFLEQNLDLGPTARENWAGMGGGGVGGGLVLITNTKFRNKKNLFSLNSFA